MNWQEDSAYHEQLAELDKACAEFRAAWQERKMEECLLCAGGLMAEVDKLYSLGVRKPHAAQGD